MSSQKLQMKYHPAKKEIEFKRFQSGDEVTIEEKSILRSYMNLKGRFVLQDHGNKFFEDIAIAFDGEKEINLEVITTKTDYKDFVKMVEYYNKDGKCKINVMLLAELPDMNQTFLAVKKHGEESISILQKHKEKLFDLSSEKEKSKKSIQEFVEIIDEEVKNIKEKIVALDDNTVNLCFAGVYSAGKSALINALLGYKILPEKIVSTTAKMYKIYSPKQNENIKLKFFINDIYSELEWNETNQRFEFTNGFIGDKTQKQLGYVINELGDRKLKQHEQIRQILEDLNVIEDISNVVEIIFPIALDTDKVQFTIYDTPGTDSNYIEHQDTLVEAIERQMQSILIFVTAPTKMEGSGNSKLLNYLKNAEEKSTKTSIDMSRSLFVVNWADSTEQEQREILRIQEIKDKDNEDLSIKLSDKKLFFTSARYAYIANAIKNKIATEEEEGDFNDRFNSIINEKYGCYYKQNHFARSEFLTESSIMQNNKLLEEAEISGDRVKQIEICSGLFALKDEIIQCGGKFASTIKAFAIIDSVDKTLAKLSNQANLEIGRVSSKIKRIENDILELERTIGRVISEGREKFIIYRDDRIPYEIIERLNLDSNSLETVINRCKRYAKKSFKIRFFRRRKKAGNKSKSRSYMLMKIREETSGFKKQFFKNRKILLEEQRDDFMTIIKKAIEENGGISKSAKKFFLDIPAPKRIKRPKIKNIGRIYDSYKREMRPFIFILDNKGKKKDFVKEIDTELTRFMTELETGYRKDYIDSLETLLNQIEELFKINLDEYSIRKKELIAEREEMMKLYNVILCAAMDLKICKNRLDKTIWEVVQCD